MFEFEKKMEKLAHEGPDKFNIPKELQTDEMFHAWNAAIIELNKMGEARLKHVRRLFNIIQRLEL